ncbi:MAG: 3 beta-hydroxysteroid dehydrogenase/Delta 5--_4-isomerase [Planctomycetes bacterium ADurb.Bin412]|nr:MAG: 3 beta-hydroxysteroid dehydrogenase/Delta 5-->4-isomerase [Planctomycetes bacterium ADurb.Bin412]
MRCAADAAGKEDRMNLVTGATGLLGSHIAERLVQAGQPVRALVRAGSDTSFLDSLRVEKIVANLANPSTLAAACQGVEVVYHAAARVGDWGPWSEFQRDTIEATKNMAEAAQKAGVRRFLHISSISAYGHPNGKNLVLDETAPLGTNLHRWSYYSIAKVEAEKLLWQMHRQQGLGLTVIRPSWIYGPRDRTSIARLHRMFTTGRIKILGSGNNRLNTVYAGNVADACLLAAQKEAAIGQAYNCSNDGEITQKEYMDKFAAAFGCRPPARKVPYWLAYSVGFDCECIGRLLRLKKPPFITRYSVWLMGRDVFFSTEKARRQLGWQSRIGYDEGIPLTAKWYLKRLA